MYTVVTFHAIISFLFCPERRKGFGRVERLNLKKKKRRAPDREGSTSATSKRKTERAQVPAPVRARTVLQALTHSLTHSFSQSVRQSTNHSRFRFSRHFRIHVHGFIPLAFEAFFFRKKKLILFSALRNWRISMEWCWFFPVFFILMWNDCFVLLLPLRRKAPLLQLRPRFRASPTTVSSIVVQKSRDLWFRLTLITLSCLIVVNWK